jgi:hypothetical protein
LRFLQKLQDSCGLSRPFILVSARVEDADEVVMSAIVEGSRLSNYSRKLSLSPMIHLAAALLL